MTQEEITAAVRQALKEHEKTISCINRCRLTEDDVVFFHRFKNAIDKTASGVGLAIMLGILSAIAYVLKIGLDHWNVKP